MSKTWPAARPFLRRPAPVVDGAGTTDFRIPPPRLGLDEPAPVLPRPLGGSGLNVFPIALGTSNFGWTAGIREADEVLGHYLAGGGMLIDTADSYAAGRSEHMIGSWLRGARRRDDVVLSTKVGRHPDYPGLGSVSLVRAVEDSLQRLQTDRIDLLTFHVDDREVPFEDALGTAAWLIESGKVRAIGVSGYAAERLVEARILAAAGYPRVDVLHTHYSLMTRRTFEGDAQMVATGQRLGVLPYFALESGFLAGGYRERATGATPARERRARTHVNRRGLRVLTAIDRLALAHAVEPATVALSWLLSRPGITAPVVSCQGAEHVDSVLAAAELRLTAEELAGLDRASER